MQAMGEMILEKRQYIFHPTIFINPKYHQGIKKIDLCKVQPKKKTWSKSYFCLFFLLIEYFVLFPHKMKFNENETRSLNFILFLQINKMRKIKKTCLVKNAHQNKMKKNYCWLELIHLQDHI